MKLSRAWRERLHPWRTIARLHERDRHQSESIMLLTEETSQLRRRLEDQQREMRTLAGTTGLSVGWEQAGAVTPEFVIVGTSRGREPGVRIYASRELAAPAVQITDVAGSTLRQVKLEAVLGRALILNETDRRTGVVAVMTIFDNQERHEREASAEAEKYIS